MKTHEAAYNIYKEITNGNLKHIDYDTKQNIKILITNALRCDDIDIETWHCNADCKYINESICKGEINSDNNSDKICPYFRNKL